MESWSQISTRYLGHETSLDEGFIEVLSLSPEKEYNFFDEEITPPMTPISSPLTAWVVPDKSFSRKDGAEHENCSGGMDLDQAQRTMQHLDKKFQKISQDLDKLTRRTGMPIAQENGQRIYGPLPHLKDVVPPRGSEVFVGKLPRDCIETEIVPVFEKVGRIFTLRLMMDFSGSNRGYCFVQYHNPMEASRAVAELNHYEIRPGRFIGVTKSVDNCRLFLGGIPKDKSEANIFKEISRVTESVVKVIAYPSAKEKTKNRGYAFIEYESHKAAAMARRKMIPGKIQLWGKDCAVDWAEPEPDRFVKMPTQPQRSGSYSVPPFQFQARGIQLCGKDSAVDWSRPEPYRFVMPSQPQHSSSYSVPPGRGIQRCGRDSAVDWAEPEPYRFVMPSQPQRSGSYSIPPFQFQGRGIGGW